MKTTPTHLAQTRPLFLNFKQFLKQRVISLFSFFWFWFLNLWRLWFWSSQASEDLRGQYCQYSETYPKNRPGEAVDDSPDPMSLLPTLLSPGAASPRSASAMRIDFFWKNMIHINSIWFKMIEHWFNWFNSLYLFVMSLHFATCFYCCQILSRCLKHVKLKLRQFSQGQRSYAVLLRSPHCYCIAASFCRLVLLM